MKEEFLPIDTDDRWLGRLGKYRNGPVGGARHALADGGLLHVDRFVAVDGDGVAAVTGAEGLVHGSDLLSSYSFSSPRVGRSVYMTRLARRC